MQCLKASAIVIARKVDIVNSMLQKLEKYADNLECLVEQRTAQVEEEKLKTEKLLYRMLPPLVFLRLIADKITNNIISRAHLNNLCLLKTHLVFITQYAKNACL